MDYEVFLNFRGPDTRQGSVSCLVHCFDKLRINLFYDRKSIREGGEIPDEILKAIEIARFEVLGHRPHLSQFTNMGRHLEGSRSGALHILFLTPLTSSRCISLMTRRLTPPKGLGSVDMKASYPCHDPVAPWAWTSLSYTKALVA